MGALFAFQVDTVSYYGINYEIRLGLSTYAYSDSCTLSFGEVSLGEIRQLVTQPEAFLNYLYRWVTEEADEEFAHCFERFLKAGGSYILVTSGQQQRFTFDGLNLEAYSPEIDDE